MSAKLKAEVPAPDADIRALLGEDGDTPSPGNQYDTAALLTIEDAKASHSRDVWREIYLAYIRRGANVSEACRAIGIARTTANRWERDPEFAAKVREARIYSVSDLENEAHRRAMRGSDRLLMFLLAAKKPEVYTPLSKLEHSGRVDLASQIIEARARSGGA